jgi:hypothetical protein
MERFRPFSFWAKDLQRLHIAALPLLQQVRRQSLDLPYDEPVSGK